MTDSKDIDIDRCCCQYVNQNDERYHILDCCCNCFHFDQIAEDRLRGPWRRGAKEVSLDTVIPVLVIPLVIGIAAINFYCSIIMCLATPSFLGYFYYYMQNGIPSSRFFFMWTLWSVIYLLVLFELTVPLLELLPEENYLLISCVILSLVLLFKTRQRAHRNFVVQGMASEDDLPDIAEEQTLVSIENEENSVNDYHPTICSICRKYTPPRTFHCAICHACIIRRDHHSFWLNCCIGESNHRYYVLGLICSLIALLLGANLTLTSVCHPFLLFKVFSIPILLPDDCSEVYDQYDMGVSFIVSVYSLLIAALIIIELVMQAYLISNGLTISEWRSGQSGNRKSICWNWKTFICWFN